MIMSTVTMFIPLLNNLSKSKYSKASKQTMAENTS